MYIGCNSVKMYFGSTKLYCMEQNYKFNFDKM